MYDIFSKEKVLKKENDLKEVIEVDFREKNSLVPSEIIKQGLTIDFKQLKTGDYIVKGVVIERKSVSDFFSSVFDKRLFNQLENLKQYEKNLLIVEGNLNKDSRMHENALRGLLLSIGLNYKVPIIFTKNEEETSTYISLIAKKEKRGFSLNQKKKNLSQNEELQFILESFSGVGPIKARSLLEKFKTLKKIFSSSEKDLSYILGNNSKNFLEIIKRKYS
ncbi:hypothetical protein J4412_00900 [Candidatus Pacearchaeota archaeon]|nr:MAG: hypothetical protein QJ16_C0005G0006 [archaeon GW2011_AR1]MBS3078047.1 hypothetical protein [Candidatus Pacearchaeota archaeon]HIH51971.1 hypothetical protein [Nanoarchaeota archaeon]